MLLLLLLFYLDQDEGMRIWHSPRCRQNQPHRNLSRYWEAEEELVGLLVYRSSSSQTGKSTWANCAGAAYTAEGMHESRLCSPSEVDQLRSVQRARTEQRELEWRAWTPSPSMRNLSQKEETAWKEKRDPSVFYRRRELLEQARGHLKCVHICVCMDVRMEYSRMNYHFM